MTPENMPVPPAEIGTTPALRPPDFLLPQSERTAAGRRGGTPEIYVSRDGQIFGPAGIDDVLSGVRTAYFEKSALFWCEGQEAWRPIDELGELFEEESLELPAAATAKRPPAEPIRPSWPGRRSSTRSSGGRHRRRKENAPRSSRSDRSNRAGRLIVIGAVLLAVAITAGLLVLLSFV